MLFFSICLSPHYSDESYYFLLGHLADAKSSETWLLCSRGVQQQLREKITKVIQPACEVFIIIVELKKTYKALHSFAWIGLKELSNAQPIPTPKSAIFFWEQQLVLWSNELDLNWPLSLRNKLNYVENFSSILGSYTTLFFGSFWPLEHCELHYVPSGR